jgi:ATP-dependent Clp protease ATP-binding subunit ClpA
MFERFSTASRRAVFCARLEAGFVGSQIIDSEHLLLGLLRVDPTTLQFIAQPVTLTSVREAAARWHVPGEKLPTSVDLPITEDVKLVFENAGSFVRTEHLLLALMTITTSHAAAILGEVDASLSRLEQLVSGIQDHEIKTVLNFPEKISSPSNRPLVRHVVLQNGLR